MQLQNLIKKYWLLALFLSLSFFWGTKSQVSGLKVQIPLQWSLYHSSQVSQSKELFCSLKIKKKNPQWIGGPREEVSPKSSFSEVKGGLRGCLSVSHFLLFGLCALGEKVERAWGWFGWWGFQSAGFHLAQSISTLSLSFLTCKMMKSSFSSKTLIGVCTGLERGRWYVWLCVIVYACVW